MRIGTTLEENKPPRLVRLANDCAAALHEMGLGPAELTASQMIAVARRRSGLDDFGEGEFFEALSRLLESCQREAELNLIGRVALRADVLHCLSHRLLLQRDRIKHPEIEQEQVSAPVFIVGLPRTGTTILHTLLMADPAHRAPLTWQVMQPSPIGDDHRERRIRKTARSLSCLRWLAPSFSQVHAVGAELPQECVSLMSLSFLSDQFDTMYNIPSYRRWFLQQDLSPAYAWHRRFLQHLQFGRSECRWILKAPAHMFAVPNLLSVYPNARFVQTHRAPLQAITSVSSLITILRRIFSHSVDPVEIGREAMRYWAQTLQRFLTDRERLEPERVCDLPYQDIRRDPIAAVRRIYEHFNWELSGVTEQRMREVLANQPPEQVGSHRYIPAQFGLEVEEMAELFAGYCELFDLPVQEHDGNNESLRYSAAGPRATATVALPAGGALFGP
jgi:hypothetical protein